MRERIGIYCHRRNRSYSLSLLRALNRRGVLARRFTPTSSMNRAWSVWDMDVLVNWGCSVPPDWEYHGSNMKWVNTPAMVGHNADKVRWFRNTSANQTVPYTTSREVVESWLSNGARVAARTLTRAHSGRGLVVLHPGDDVVPAPLYTKLIRGTNVREFRAIVDRGGVVHWKRKRRRRGLEYEGNAALVRSRANGWVYTIEDVWSDCAPGAEGSIRSAVAHDVGSMFINDELDFGTYDFLADTQTGEVWALECNTAPGLSSPSTMEAITSCIINPNKPIDP